jgi:putative multicomponent Na+:H+ antiporter subunit B
MILMIYGFFIILIIISIYILFQNNNLKALIAYGIFGAAISGIFFLMNAPDVALVEITVGSAFIFFIYLIAIKKVAKIKVLYLETPYMIEEINDELRGFEYNLIKEFLDEKGLEANFIKIKTKKPLMELKDYGDILIGGICPLIEVDGITFSKEILPTKILKSGKGLKSPIGIILKNKNQNIYPVEELEENFIIDLVRLKYLFLLGKKFDEKELLELHKTGYKVAFNKKDEFLANEFNEYISQIKKDEKKYNELIRRYIG